MKISKPSIIIIGPKPPPFHGVSMATAQLFSKELKQEFKVHHVDLADRRGIQHVDKPDFYDVLLFFQQFYILIKKVIFQKPLLGYLPISQRSIGFIRDSLFVLVLSICRSKIILHLHGGNFRDWYNKQPVFFRFYIRIVLNQISTMIVLSETFRNMFNDIVPLMKVTVVPNGVEYRSPIIKKTEEKNTITILYLGTLNKLKGVLVLIRSIPLVLREQSKIKFVFAGSWSDDNDKNEAEKFIKNHDLSKFVKFVGLVQGNSKWNALGTGDIFIFPGIQQEGQPLVVLEALAAGLPIIYTNQGCLKETITNYVNGIMIKTNDPIDIADKIICLIRNPSLRSKIGKRNLALFKSKYTIVHYSKNMLKVFLNILNNLNN